MTADHSSLTQSRSHEEPIPCWTCPTNYHSAHVMEPASLTNHGYDENWFAMARNDGRGREHMGHHNERCNREGSAGIVRLLTITYFKQAIRCPCGCFPYLGIAIGETRGNLIGRFSRAQCSLNIHTRLYLRPWRSEHESATDDLPYRMTAAVRRTRERSSDTAGRNERPLGEPVSLNDPDMDDLDRTTNHSRR